MLHLVTHSWLSSWLGRCACWDGVSQAGETARLRWEGMGTCCWKMDERWMKHLARGRRGEGTAVCHAVAVVSGWLLVVVVSFA